MIISDERLEQALRYLANTDAKYAVAKSEADRMDDMTKVVYGQCYAESVGDTVKEREHSAYTDAAYQNHIHELAEAKRVVFDYANKRETQRVIYEAWRTLQANNRGK